MAQSALSEETLSLLGGKTKGKILKASLRLFNEFGFDRVTTAQIANASDVLEGTLWYHFKAKHDLIFAHLDALEARIDMHLAVEVSQSPMEVIRYIYGIFDFLWDFRYLQRDPIEYLRHDPVGIERAKSTIRLLEQRTKARLSDAEEAGILDLTGADLDRMVMTTIMTGRYWLDYAMTRDGGVINLPKMKAEGLALILEIQKPYFNGEFRAIVSDPRIVEMIQQFLEAPS